MDALDRKIKADIATAKVAIIMEADPNNGPKCPHCGKPAKSGIFRTSWELRKAARGSLESGIMGLAMYALKDAKVFEQDHRYRLRLNSRGKYLARHYRKHPPG